MSEPGILPNPIPFGKYYLLERINVGGMAEVYKAKAFGVEGFERLLAVKKILSSIAEDESFISMFIDEAKIAGQLNHPNIAQIFDLGMVDGSYFIALEYIGGKDLKTIFERSRRLGEKVSIPRVCYVTMKVCEGLGHAHHKKNPDGQDLSIVHRDVSPQNVLMSYEGEVKIIDFGIAKASTKQSQTQVGILKGKFSYMSPEQVRGLHVDHRSDIFSLGIVLYEMLTLERLFLGESDFDTLEKIRKVEMSPPSLYNPHIPKELEDIVLKALARSPDDRYQTTFEFGEALERFMRNQGYYYTNKDLASYMKDGFSADIEFENKKLEYYRSLNLQPLEGNQKNGYSNGSNGANGFADPGLAWGEEEMETQIFDRYEEEIGESDIIYAEEVPSMVDAEPDFSFDDSPPSSVRTPRAKQPTAKVNAVGTRTTRTTNPSPAARRKKGSSLGVIIGIAVAVFLIGGAGLYLLKDRIGQEAPMVMFETQPAEIEVWVDGKKHWSGATPKSIELPSGEHQVEIRAEGHESYVVSRNFTSDEEYTFKHRLSPLVASKHKLVITTEPAGAKVFVGDEERAAETPATLEGVEGPKVSIKVLKDGFIEELRDIDLTKPEESLELKLRPKMVHLTVDSDPGRTEFTVFDSEDRRVFTGKTPEKVEKLDATRTYKVVFERSGYEKKTATFEPGFEVDDKLEVDLEREGREVASSSSKSNSGSSTVATKDPIRKDPIKKDPVKKDPPKKDPPKKDPAPTGTGTLMIGSKPAARVYIDGEDTGRHTPLINFKIQAGKHKIRLVNEEFGLNKTFYVDIKPGANERIINR